MWYRSESPSFLINYHMYRVQVDTWGSDWNYLHNLDQDHCNICRNIFWYLENSSLYNILVSQNIKPVILWNWIVFLNCSIICLCPCLMLCFFMLGQLGGSVLGYNEIYLIISYFLKISICPPIQRQPRRGLKYNFKETYVA